MPWSDWQDGELLTFQAETVLVFGDLRTDGVGDVTDRHADTATLVDAARVNVLAGSGPTYTAGDGQTQGYFEQPHPESGDPLDTGARMDFQQFRDNDTAVGGWCWGSFYAGQLSATYDGSSNATYQDPSPPLLDTLVYGVDYIENPGTGNLVEYESDTSAFDGWDDWDVEAIIRAWLVGISEGATLTAPAAVRVASIDGGADSAERWIAPDDSRLVDVASIVGPTVYADSVPDPVAYTQTADLSALTSPRVTVVALPPFLDGSDMGLTDLSSPAVTPLYLNWGGTFWAYMNFGISAPSVRYQLPRWRYWIPTFIQGWWG